MTRKSKGPFSSHDGQLMVTAAHRYCLGRRTYIVGACCEWLRTNWGEFDTNTKNIILRDTIYALMDGDAGDNCDIISWTTFARFGFDEISEENQRWVKDAVAWRGKEWPL